MRVLLAVFFACGSLHASGQNQLAVTEDNNCCVDEFRNPALAEGAVFAAIKQQAGYSDVRFYWFDSVIANGIIADAAEQNIYIERSLGNRILERRIDSIRFCFLLVREIAKMKVLAFCKTKKQPRPGRMLLEAEGDYLAAMYFFHPAFSLPYPDEELIKLLATDLQFPANELCFWAKQRQYLFRQAIAHCRQPQAKHTDSFLGVLKQLVYTGKDPGSMLFSFVIQGKEYAVKYFDSVFVKQPGGEMRCGYIQALNPDIWYYQFRIFITGSNGGKTVYYADRNNRIYDAMYRGVGEILP